MIYRLLNRLVIAKVLWLAISLSTAFAENSPCTGLAEQMALRLSLMEEVAAYKYLHDRPVEDAEREARLLAAMEEQGKQMELHPEVVRAFFTAQIEAAKAIQEVRIAAWKAGEVPAPQEAPDLAKDVRPVLDQISAGMLKELGSVLAGGAAAEDAAACLRARGFPERAVNLALRGWPVR